MMVFKMKLLLFIGFSFFSLISCAFQPDMKIVKVKKPLKSYLDSISCSKYRSVKINWVRGEQYPEQSSPTVVYAHCDSHTTFQNFPLRSVFKCIKQQKEWKCEEHSVEVIMEINQRKLAITSDMDYLHEAVDIVTFLGTKNKFKENAYFKEDKNSENECTIHKTKEPGWAVFCDAWGANVRKVCGADTCEYEFLSEGPVMN